jgi:hypothetical protein
MLLEEAVDLTRKTPASQLTPVESVQLHSLRGARGPYDAITVRIGGLSLRCDLVNDRQLRLASILAQSYGCELGIEPQYRERVSRALERGRPSDLNRREPIQATSIRLSNRATTSGEFDAIVVVIADLHLVVELVDDSQIRLAKQLSASHGLELWAVHPHLVDRLERALAGPSETTVKPERDPMYNTDNFPTFICNHGNWDIYTNARGKCAAIPSEDGAAMGCKASQFGDRVYVKQTLPAEYAAWEKLHEAQVVTLPDGQSNDRAVGRETVL